MYYPRFRSPFRSWFSDVSLYHRTAFLHNKVRSGADIIFYIVFRFGYQLPQFVLAVNAAGIFICLIFRQYEELLFSEFLKNFPRKISRCRVSYPRICMRFCNKTRFSPLRKATSLLHYSLFLITSPKSLRQKPPRTGSVNSE